MKLISYPLAPTLSKFGNGSNNCCVLKFAPSMEWNKMQDAHGIFLSRDKRKQSQKPHIETIDDRLFKNP